MGFVTVGSRLKIRAYSAVNALVKCWADAAETTAFDLTGYSSLRASAKLQLTDTTALVPLTATVSLVGYDDAGEEIVVTEADGWIQVYAESTDTEAVQAVAEVDGECGVQGYWDCTAIKDGIRRPVIGMGYVDFLPAATRGDA